MRRSQSLSTARPCWVLRSPKNIYMKVAEMRYDFQTVGRVPSALDGKFTVAEKMNTIQEDRRSLSLLLSLLFFFVL
jgi:hypothetical protein